MALRNSNVLPQNETNHPKNVVKIHHSIVYGRTDILVSNESTNTTTKFNFNCMSLVSIVGVTLAVEQIVPDKLWLSTCIPELENYFFGHIF